MLVILGFIGGMGYWYLQVRDVNAQADAANARLDAFVSGRAAVQNAVAAGDYREAVTAGLALQGTIELRGDENVDILGLEGFAYYNLAATENGTARRDDLRASRDAYEAALAGLNGVQDGRYASICASLGGVYHALADFEDWTANLQTALDYYQQNVDYAGAQDPAVKVKSFTMIAFIKDELQAG
jgi:predicted negative regulator of RcsB-dependent stress response